MSEYTLGAMRAATRIFSKMHSYAGLECWIVPDMACEIDKEFADLLAACRLALTFINNGIEFGYITMPDKGDSALLTPEFLRAAIAKAEGVGASPPGDGKESR